MIEWIMLFALGFCTAGILAVLAIPSIWRRAAKITGRRIRGALPVSMSEIQADKDQMRAEFAMAARKLERSIDELKQKAARHQAEIGKRDEIIRSQKIEIANRRRTEDELIERIEKLDARLARSDKEIAARDKTIAAREATISEIQTSLSGREAELAELASVSDTRRVELVALKTRAEALKATVAERDERINAMKADIAKRDHRIDELQQVIAERDSELSAKEAEIRRLRQSIDKQETVIAEADANVAGLKRALTTERKLVEEKEKEIAAIQSAISERSTEAGRLAAQLANANKQRLRAEEKLKQLIEQQENGAGKSPSGVVANGSATSTGADAAWEEEKRENALLREHLNDLAAEVVSLTSALDGEDGEIRAMANQAAASAEKAPGKTINSLAERIRALQSQVARQ